MLVNLVPPVIAMGCLIAAMSAFGVWCGLGPLQAVGIATGGVFGCLVILAVIGGIVQMVLAGRADRNSFGG